MEVLQHIIQNLTPTLEKLVINDQILNTKNSDIFKMITVLIQTVTEKNIMKAINLLYLQLLEYPKTEQLFRVRQQVNTIYDFYKDQAEAPNNAQLKRQCNELRDEIKNTLIKITYNTSDTKVYIYHQDAMALISEKQFQYIIKNYEQYIKQEYVMDYKTVVIYILLYVQLCNIQQNMINYYKELNYEQDQIDHIIQRNSHLNVMENNQLLYYFKHTLASKIVKIVHNEYINNHIIKLYNMQLSFKQNNKISYQTLKILNLTVWNNISYLDDPELVIFLLFVNILQLKCKEKSLYNNNVSPIQKLAEIIAYINKNKYLDKDYINILLKNEWNFYQQYYPLNNNITPTILYKIPKRHVQSIDELIKILEDQFVNQVQQDTNQQDNLNSVNPYIYIFEPTYSFLFFFIQYLDQSTNKKHQQLLAQHLVSELNYQLFIQHKQQYNVYQYSPMMPCVQYYRAFYKADCVSAGIVYDKNLIFAKILVNLLITKIPSYAQIMTLYQLTLSLVEKGYFVNQFTPQLKQAFQRVINYKFGLQQLQLELMEFYSQIYQKKTGSDVKLEVLSRINLTEAQKYPEKFAFSVLNLDYIKLYEKQKKLESAYNNKNDNRLVIETLENQKLFAITISFYQLQLMICLLNNPTSSQYKALLHDELNRL